VTGTSDLRKLRPQQFGRRGVRQVHDPLIEPLWRGTRVLVSVSDPGPVEFVDDGGEPLEGEDIDAIAGQITGAIRAESLVLDGYLTYQATADVSVDANLGIAMPSAQQMVGQLIFGRRGAGVAAKAVSDPKREPEPTSPLAFVAVDIVALDGEPLVDVPLLERKRLLESAIEESPLVRRGAYVRPPVDSWLVAWRAIGFRELAYKGANSRYVPGAQNDDWATITIPRD
jgi:hypothetical protein